MYAPPKSTKPAEVKRKYVKNWLSGTVTAYDDGRTPLDGLRSSGNVILDQDGTVRPRPSLTQYGPQPTGTILGEIFEFSAFDGLSATNWMITLQNVAGTTNVYIAKGEDTSWTLCSGKTYDNSASAHFFQLADKVVVMNGVDTLSYLDIPTSTVIGFNALTTPSAPTLDTLTSLTGTSFNVYYAVTANSTVGETDGSAVLTQPVSTDRDLWNPDTQSVKIKWTTVTGVKSWNVYMGVSSDGAGIPTMYLLAGGIDPTILSFTDNGSRALDLSRPLPTSNSTSGPKVSRGANINGRAWLTGDADNPFYVWRGGDFGYEMDFSPANGGGYTPVGNGSKELPIKAVQFRSGTGDPRVTVLSKGTNGRGKRHLLTPNNLTYGNTTFVVWEVTEDNGQDGTDSPDGVVIYNDTIWYPSRDGFKTTGTKPQLQNILSTDRVSDTIQPDISTLNNSAMDRCVGLAHEDRIYWALPVGGSMNSEIWVLDIGRKGAWMKPWSLSADWMTLYNDNDGTTHFLVLSNNKIYQLSYTALTADDGVAFPTNGNSGQITFSDDGRMWGRLIKLIFVLLRPQGAIYFSVDGHTEDEPISNVGTGSFSPTSTRAGWSEPQVSWSGQRGWSEVVAVPVSFNDATQEVSVDVDEDVQWYSYAWSTADAGVSYNLADVIAEYVEVGIKDLS